MLPTQIGQPITVIVKPEWYETMRHSTILTPPDHSNPNMFEATLEEASDPYGIWVTLDHKFTGDRGLRLLVPWSEIVAIGIWGERVKSPVGFGTAASE
jgi:hypothetical protein